VTAAAAPLPLLLAGGRLADGRPADALCEAGRIARLAAPGSFEPPPGAVVEDLRGALLLPGLVEGHVHLDKTLLGAPAGWIPHRPGASVPERIAREKEVRAELGGPSRERALALLGRLVAAGSTLVRSHVDLDAEVGLRGVETLLALREEARHLADVQLVAFPQSGLVTHRGAAELVEEALRLGVEVVGGLDPAGIDGDVEGQLGTVFGLAERFGAMVDIHLHDPGELGAFELRRIAAVTRAAGLGGRVAVSHAFALGAVDDAVFAATAAALAEAGVAVMTNGPGPAPMPPVRRLTEAGVLVFAGSDNIRDAWSPLGDGDPLSTAHRIAWRQGLATDRDLDLAFALVSAHAATALGAEGYGLREGGPADLVAVRADAGVPEAVAARPPRALVVKAGRVVAREGRLA
jgi:cytosine/creatinine deaminase